MIGLALVPIAVLAAGCGTATNDASKSSGHVKVVDCDKSASFPVPARRLFVNDGNMIAMALSVGAAENVAAISSLGDDRTALEKAYGKQTVESLHEAAKDYPTLENVIAARPDVMIAGWGYGYKEESKLTPASLKQKGIAAYVLSESCRQAGDDARGVVPPWTALRTDLTNIGRITGHEDKAKQTVADLDRRLDALRHAPQPAHKPTVFLFDSGTTEPFSSGRFGGPEAIIEAAGASNAIGDIKDTWTTVSWERIARAQPDAIAFVDYPGQTFEQKVAVLQKNPATKNLPAVKEKRFLNLPYATWTSSPLNIDAAEQLRHSLETWDLVPHSTIQPRLDLRP